MKRRLTDQRIISIIREQQAGPQAGFGDMEAENRAQACK